jgi:hypothetical protein
LKSREWQDRWFTREARVCQAKIERDRIAELILCTYAAIDEKIIAANITDILGS